MRSYDRYIQSGLIYRINFNFNFYIKYIVANYFLYLLLIIEADWARVVKKKKKLE